MFKQLKYIIILLFVVYSFGPLPVYCAEGVFLPKPGVMVHLSPAMNAPAFKGIKVYPNDPLKLDFILDQPANSTSSTGGNRSKKNEEANKLVKYFLTALTIPENDLWVNLSPYEKDRIISDKLGQTDLGRDMLAQDYLLKQITASLMHPDGEVGKKFWEKIYQEASEKFGTTNVPVNTINKVWIVPDKAEVFDNSKGTAYITKATLKVMLEEDYLAISRQPGDIDSLGAFQRQLSQCPQAGCQASNVMNAKATQGITGSRHHISQKDWQSQITREIIIPELTTEVNEGKNFAPLRQVYHAIILAAWYKRTIKTNIIAAQFVDQYKIQGIDIQAQTAAIYQQYLKAYKKGVSNFIREEEDLHTHQKIPRKYFTGGEQFSQISDLMYISAQTPLVRRDVAMVSVNLSIVKLKDNEMYDNTLSGSLKELRGSNEKLAELTDETDPAMPVDFSKLRTPQKVLFVSLYYRSKWGQAIVELGNLFFAIEQRWPDLDTFDVVTNASEIAQWISPKINVVNLTEIVGNKYDLIITDLPPTKEQRTQLSGLLESEGRLIEDYKNIPTIESVGVGMSYSQRTRAFLQVIGLSPQRGNLPLNSSARNDNGFVLVNPYAMTLGVGENSDRRVFEQSVSFWVSLIDKLIEGGYKVGINSPKVVTDSPEFNLEFERAIFIRLRNPEKVFRIKKTKSEMLRFLKDARAVITKDTGLYHAASELLGIPTVVLAGKNTSWINYNAPNSVTLDWNQNVTQADNVISSFEGLLANSARSSTDEAASSIINAGSIDSAMNIGFQHVLTDKGMMALEESFGDDVSKVLSFLGVTVDQIKGYQGPENVIGHEHVWKHFMLLHSGVEIVFYTKTRPYDGLNTLAMRYDLGPDWMRLDDKMIVEKKVKGEVLDNFLSSINTYTGLIAITKAIGKSLGQLHYQMRYVHGDLEMKLKEHIFINVVDGQVTARFIDFHLAHKIEVDKTFPFINEKSGVWSHLYLLIKAKKELMKKNRVVFSRTMDVELRKAFDEGYQDGASNPLDGGRAKIVNDLAMVNAKTNEGGVDFREVNKGVVVNRLSGSEPIALSSSGIVIKQGLNFTIINSSTVNLQDWLLN